MQVPVQHIQGRTLAYPSHNSEEGGLDLLSFATEVGRGLPARHQQVSSPVHYMQHTMKLLLGVVMCARWLGEHHAAHSHVHIFC